MSETPDQALARLRETSKADLIKDLGPSFFVPGSMPLHHFGKRWMIEQIMRRDFGQAPDSAWGRVAEA